MAARFVKTDICGQKQRERSFVEKTGVYPSQPKIKLAGGSFHKLFMLLSLVRAVRSQRQRDPKTVF